MYIGSPNFTVKEIVKDFFDVWKKDFYIPIDISHLFGIPSRVRYNFDISKSFEENWKKVVAIKTN